MARLGIAGFGRLVRDYYVPAISTLPEIEVVAIADPLADSRAAAARRFPGARIHSDSQVLFEQERIDALLIASPPSTHLTLWNEAAGRQIPVLMEKPFVLRGEIARAASSPEARQLLMPNFNRRWWPAYRAMRQLCADGRVGEIESARFTLRVDIAPWCSVTRHRLAPAEGGPLYDLGSSELDLIEYVLGGRIESVSARIDSPAEHEVFLEIMLTGGVRVECELAYAARNRESISIVGSKASLRLDNPNFALDVAARGKRTFPPLRWVQDVAAFGVRAAQRSRSMLRYTIRASLAEFIDALTIGRPFSPGFDDAAHNSACLEAAIRSAADCKQVFLETIGGRAGVLEAQA
jgi:myo-inositol 2-dehydrogenase/D-chiro-inositol 1-dehydrogenase